MERIRPPTRKATLLRDGASFEVCVHRNIALSCILIPRPPPFARIASCSNVQVDCLCELGVYGIYLATRLPSGGSDVLLNQSAGHLLRVKPASVNEGGVAAGFAVLSSPRLVDL